MVFSPTKLVVLPRIVAAPSTIAKIMLDCFATVRHETYRRCDHCRELVPEFEEVAKKAAEEKPPTLMG